jgi:hypothetical protein
MWGGDPVACTRSARYPLGETYNWGIKASLRRDYLGVDERLAVYVKVYVKGDRGDQLRLI